MGTRRRPFGLQMGKQLITKNMTFRTTASWKVNSHLRSKFGFQWFQIEFAQNQLKMTFFQHNCKTVHFCILRFWFKSQACYVITKVMHFHITSLHVDGKFSYIKSKYLQRPKSIKKIVTSRLRHSTPSAKASTMRRPSSAFVELSGRPQKASFLLATKQQLNRRPCYEVAQLLLWCSRYYMERECNTWPLRGL